MRREVLYVGWVRTNWKHWEPITLPPREIVEAARRLYEHKSCDKRDGEKVLLPEGVPPTGPVREV